MDNLIVGFMKSTESILKTNGKIVDGLVDTTISSHEEIEKMKKVLAALIEDSNSSDAREEYYFHFGERLLLESDLQS